MIVWIHCTLTALLATCLIVSRRELLRMRGESVLRFLKCHGRETDRTWVDGVDIVVHLGCNVRAAVSVLKKLEAVGFIARRSFEKGRRYEYMLMRR